MALSQAWQSQQSEVREPGSVGGQPWPLGLKLVPALSVRLTCFLIFRAMASIECVGSFFSSPHQAQVLGANRPEGNTLALGSTNLASKGVTLRTASWGLLWPPDGVPDIHEHLCSGILYTLALKSRM